MPISQSVSQSEVYYAQHDITHCTATVVQQIADHGTHTYYIIADGMGHWIYPQGATRRSGLSSDQAQVKSASLGGGQIFFFKNYFYKT